MDKLNEISESQKFETDNIEIQEFFRSKTKLNKPILFIIDKQIDTNQKNIKNNSVDNNLNGVILKKLRIKIGITQEKLGDLLGIDKVFIAQFEKNLDIPILEKRVINSILEIKIDKEEALMGHTKSKPVEPDLFNIEEVTLKQNNMDNLNIIKIRNEMGLTIQQFANLLEMDRRSISNWESGKVKIPESKIKLVEFLVEKNKIKLTADSNVESSNDKSMENLNNEIMYLKDHIKTLKESLDDKNKIACMYNSELTSLKEKLAFFNNKES